MRKFARTHWKILIAILLAIALATLTLETDSAEPDGAARLQAHAVALAGAGGHGAMPHVTATLRGYGYRPRRDGQDVEAVLSNTASGARAERTFIVGVRLGADAGSAAALLELARLLKDVRPSRGTALRLVFLGEGTGNFIAFAGPAAVSARMRQALGGFAAMPDKPAQGLAAPAHAMGVTLSSHASTGQPALLVTETAFLRYPYYHTAEDRPEQLDYASMARVVQGLARTIESLAGAAKT
ncbi:hypothetical protein LQ564_05250 [Massilia sp. G4R7]|uniref:Peptidase M28 domain-containing protein n=1 Tax=Massilia phyllostachyos TaxID=2898585 RepID=A0ABS8Q1V2_9BURK|nr:hypothetical protein [Massilia phyllostachyos]MCD2515717.1 hypothetical protein [Massilia phyllostachyos]